MYKNIEIWIEIFDKDISEDDITSIVAALKPDDTGLTETKISYSTVNRKLMIYISTTRGLESARATLNDIFRCLRTLLGIMDLNKPYKE